MRWTDSIGYNQINCNIVWLTGFKCYGVYIGSKQFVQHCLSLKVDTLIAKVDKVFELLQAVLSLLLASISQQFDLLFSLKYPSDMHLAVERIDKKFELSLRV